VRRNAVGNLSLGGASLKASYIKLPYRFFFFLKILFIFKKEKKRKLL